MTLYIRRFALATLVAGSLSASVPNVALTAGDKVQTDSAPNERHTLFAPINPYPPETSSEPASWLFSGTGLYTAHQANITGHSKFTFSQARNIIGFTDRPSRKAKTMTVSQIAKTFEDEKAANADSYEPPNAVLVVAKDGAIHSVAVKLTDHQKVAEDAMEFRFMLIGEVIGAATALDAISGCVECEMSMFVDSVSMKDGVTVYEHTNFNGIQATFAPGDYNVESHGMPNDAISAIVVKPGFKAKVYQNINSNNGGLAGWDKTLSVGRYDGDELSKRGVKNDEISSIKVRPVGVDFDPPLKCDTSSSAFSPSLSAALRARVHATCSCPDGFHPKNEKRISYNGCGPDGDGSFVDAIKGTLIRSGLIGEKNKKCCNHHDVCYATAMADWGKCNERQSVCIGDDTINVIQDVAVSSSAGQEAFVAAQKAFVVCAYGKSEDSFDTAYANAWHNAHVESDRNLKKPIETVVLTAATNVFGVDKVVAGAGLTIRAGSKVVDAWRWFGSAVGSLFG